MGRGAARAVTAVPRRRGSGGGRSARLRRWLERKPAVAAALIYACLALLFVSPALPPGRTLSSSDLLWFTTPYTASRPADLTRPSSEETYDEPLFLQPWLRYTRSHGLNTPLWNPYQMGGMPLLGTANGTPYSPLYLPVYVLPFWRGLAFDAALRIFVAALGMFLLARALGARFTGSLLSGIVYAFGLFMVIWLPWPQTAVWAWIPWMLLLTDRLVRRPEPLAVAGLGAVVGAEFIAGHPESMLHAFVATGLFFILRLAVLSGRDGFEPRVLLPRVGAVAAGVLLGAAVGAIWLIPFDELLRNSNDTALRGKLPAKLGLSAIGNVFTPAFWGRGTGSVTGTTLTVNRYIYTGALPLILAGTALFLGRTRQRVAIAIVGGLCLLTALGLPGLFQVVRLLPGFKQADNRRLVLYFLLAVAILAAFGIDELMQRQRASARRMLGPPLVGFGLLAVSFLWVFVVHPSPRSFGANLLVDWGLRGPPGSELIGIVVFTGSAAVLVWARLRAKVPAQTFAALALMLATVDLFRAGMGLNPAVPIAHASQPATGAIRYLQTRSPNRFVGLGSGPTPSLGAYTFPYALGLRYDIYDARGYDTPMIGRFQRYWSRMIFPSYYLFTTAPTLTPQGLRALDLLSVTDIVEAKPTSFPLVQPGLTLAYKAPDAQIYSNSGALPRAFLVGAQSVAPSANAALGAVSSPQFDPHRLAVTERKLPGLLPASRAPAGLSGTASLTSYTPDKAVVQTDARRASLLVLTDVAYPGWKATVDGKAAPVEHADYVLRGVTVPAGSHVVEFRYDPSSWKLARTLSLGGGIAILLTAVGGLVLHFRRRRA